MFMFFLILHCPFCQSVCLILFSVGLRVIKCCCSTLCTLTVFGMRGVFVLEPFFILYYKSVAFLLPMVR